MSINIGDNFSYLGKKFLDARQSFDTLEAMRLCSDVPLGFITFCKEDNKRYEYGQNGWIEYNAGTGITEEQKSQLQTAYEHSISDHVTPDEIADFATEDFVTNKIAEASIGGEVDLSGYVTDEELNAKGYLTNIPDEYATKDYVTEKIEEASINGGDGPAIDLSKYVTEEELNAGLAKKIDNIEVNEVETTDKQTALDLYSNGAVLKTIYFSGGGGSGTIPPYISSTVSDNNLLGLGGIFEFVLDFNSSAMGRGTAKILINDIEAISTSINQGENAISIPGTYFSKGDNRVTVYVIDRTGAMSNNLVFYVRYGSLEIAQDFDAYTAYEYGSVVRYYFTPTAVDTSLELTMYMRIDGELKPGVTCYSDTRGYFTFPSNLGVGAHYCEAFVTDTAGRTSNILTFNLIILDDTSMVVASDTLDPTIEEGEQLTLDYKVYMKNNTSFITKIYIDGELVNTGTCGLSTSTYSTSNLTEGIRSIKLEVYDLTETVSDYIIWTVTVTPSTYDMLQPVNAGAMFIATSMNMTNSTENREVWVGKDQEGNTINATLNEFAFNQESGWINNELLMTGASSVDVPIAPLSNNAKYGFTLDIEFASKAIGVEDALVLNLWDDEKNCGVKITTEQVILRSAEGNEAKLYYTDDEMTSVIFIIDRNEATAKIYLNGVMCSAFHLSDYYLDGVPYLEDFTVNSEIKLGGSGHARIKNLRVYQVALTSDEILNNFMANETSKAAQKELVAFQKGDHLPTLTVYCDFSGLGKDDKKPCKIVYTSTDEEKYGKSFILNHYESKLQYQGTSSMAYPIKNYRLNLRDENGDKWYYDFPKGKPECRFTLKADFMSSGHWTNTGLTKWINDNLYNYNTKDEKTMNPKKWYDLQNGGSIDDTRECIYGFPCRLILINDGNTPLNEGQNEPTPGNTKDMGIFNFNHDKDATDTMGFDQDIFPNCASYEVTANSDTSAGAFMKNSKRAYANVSSLNRIEGISLSLLDVKVGDTITLSCDKGKVGYEMMGTNSALSNDYLITPEGKTVTIPSGTLAINLWLSDETSCIIFNGVPIYRTEEPLEDVIVFEGLSDLDYIKQSFELRFPDEDDVAEDWGFMGIPGEEGTGLKALIDWVDGCTDEEFVNEFEEHFNKDYTFRYFLLVITLGMVDNLGKNMMLDTWDNKIFMPRFYDCDTICSYDNSGQLKFDVDIEMTQGYWNTSSSRLWTRIRDLFHDELIVKYNNMRQNGLSYESLMQCFYDEQIAKIPQKYYNMDYDVKYAPFADSYIGMANGDVYEHVKRWLQQRLRFVDTLYDYAPSYNNDVLTIRANTTKPMTLYIETYTPVYQHLSWYNNQMDKKKIDGKIAVEFTGTAMAATDQEVLIYGGSNIKSIKGIQSMNPNRMLIGAATKLTELDASNCPLLADVNANKANFAPHVYLNKLDISGCPLLGGNLIVSNSPLLQEIDIQDTAITGLNLPSNLRNLKVLKLPAAISNLTLNDASQLHTLEFEEGGTLQSVSMTNCNALVNVENFDIRSASSVTLNNSYGSVQELYFRDTANVSLSNMPNIERIIYTPNDEYAVFDKNHLATKPDYKISVFNAPKCTEFIVTAPQRLSYGLDDTEIKPDTVFAANSIDISNTRFTDVKLLATTDTNQLKLPSTVNNLIIDSAYDIDTDVITDANYDFIHTDLNEAYNTDYEDKVTINKVLTVPIMVNGSLTEFYAGKFELYPEGYESPADLYSATIYIEVSPGTKVSYTCDIETEVQVAYYDSNKEPIFFKYGDNLHAQTAWKTAPQDAKYVRFSFRDEVATQFAVNVNGSVSANIVPSASDGSLIFSMYAPSNTTESASGTWDMKGLVFDTFHTFGLNNNIIKAADGSITMPDRVDGYSYTIDNLTMKNEVMRYTATTINAFPTFNSDFEYAYIIEPRDSEYLYRIIAINDTPLTKINCMNSTIQKTITSVEYLDTTKVTDMRYMFQNCSSLTSLDVSGFDTTNVTSMNGMFSGCNALTSLDLSNFDTTKVTDMGSMFSGCNALTSLNVSSFVTTKVTDMRYMFNGCKALTSLDLSSFDTKNVNNMAMMFYGCNALTSLNVSSFVTTNVTSMMNMFQGCSNLTSLDLSGFVTSKVEDMGAMFRDCKALTSLNVSSFVTTNVTSMISMFYGCKALTSLDVSSFDTTNVTSMYAMFYGCAALTSLDVSNFDTTNVTSMYAMFRDCNALTSLNVSSFDTTKVTNMNGMFDACRALTSLNVSSFDTSEVTSMSYMFQNCNALTSLDLSNFDTSNVTNMNGMFLNCNALTSLDVSNFDTSKVTITDAMFQGCTALTSLNVIGWPKNDYTQTAISSLPVGDDATNEIYTTVYFSVPSGWKINNILEILLYTTNASGIRPTFDTKFDEYSVNETDNGDGTYTVCMAINNELSNLPTLISFQNKVNLLTVENINTSKVTNMGSMFSGCNALTSLDVSNFDTSNVKDMGAMFLNCNALTSLDVSNFDTSNVTNMAGMFQSCRALTSLDVSNFDTTNVTNMSSMFSGCAALTSLDVSNFDTTNVKDMGAMFSGCNALTSLDLSNFDTTNVTSMVAMFYGCAALTSLDVSSFDTTKVTNMGSMFIRCNALTSLDLSSFDTKNVNNMNGMFNGCSKLTSLDLSNFDTTNVNNMNGMFNGCSKLTSLDLSNFDTSNVTSMNGMFNGCSKLTSLDLSNFDTTNVNNMDYMFIGCNALTSLDVSGFDTSNVNSMNAMFNGCNALTSLDLSSFDTKNVTTMYIMFTDCKSLTSLDLSNLDVSKVTNMNYIFKGCNTLMSLKVTGWPKNDYTQAAISSLPVGDDSKNEIYATVYFEVPSGWEIFNELDILIYTTNTSGVKPTFNNGFSGYSVNETNNGDGTYRVKIATNDLSNLPTAISFTDNSSLLRVEKINTSEVTDMSKMFRNCSNLTYLDGSLFDTTKVTNMSYMFYGCTKLEYVNASGWNTSKVKDMSNMFKQCYVIKEIKGDFTLNACNCYCIFDACYQAPIIPTLRGTISNDFSMFSEFGLYGNMITILDLSNISYTSGNFNNIYIFHRCNIETVYPPTNITKSINAFGETNFSIETYERLFNNLASISDAQTVTLGTKVLNRLSSSIKAIAINKGWTLA